MAVIVTSKYEEDARVATKQNINFSNTQGQISSDLVEIRTHLKCYGCPCYFQE